MNLRSTAILTGLFTASTAFAAPVDVQVTIENLSPSAGTFQTPFWVAFHDGSFDSYDGGSPASPGLERLAEDGSVMFISDEFLSLGTGGIDTVIAPGGPFAPGSSASTVLTVDGDNPSMRYFSYASMVIPSNDAFIANGNPLAHAIFDESGTFIGADFFITGADVNDAGTEVNDELPENTAFFGQMMPDTGVTENGVVEAHPGYLGSFANPGMPSILADAMFAGADFSLPGYPIARITITLVESTVVGDLDGDGIVDGTDLGLLLGAWGSDDADADLNGDGLVDGADLGTLLTNWS